MLQQKRPEEDEGSEQDMLASSEDTLDHQIQGDPLTQARSQARQAAGHHHDATTAPPSEAQISLLRHGYSALMRTLKAERRELVEPQNSKLLDLIEQANELHLQVRRTVDATLDARFMAASADLGVEKLQTLPLAANPYTVKDLKHLIERVVKAENGVEGGLERIGRLAGRHWSGVVGMETMIGLSGVVDGDLQDTPKTRTKRRLESNTVGPVVKPTVLSARELSDTQTKETTDLVIEVYEQLEMLFQTHPKLPLLKVICDPTSFARSVELLFYVSFLVADGRLCVHVGDDGCVWVSLSVDMEHDVRGKKKHHQIVTLSQSLWQNACKEYAILEPLINLQ